MGVSEVANMESRFADGKFEVDDLIAAPDHRALGQILEALRRVCQNPGAADCRCTHSPGAPSSCHRLLIELCGRIQTLLLDHFEREHELMNSLPRSGASKAHCERHRREHVHFSTRYNQAAARLGDRPPATGAQELEVLVVDWIRTHALELDEELSALLACARKARHGYA